MDFKLQSKATSKAHLQPLVLPGNGQEVRFPLKPLPVLAQPLPIYFCSAVVSGPVVSVLSVDLQGLFSGWRQIEKKMGICLSLPSPPTQNLNIITYFFLWPWMAHFITLPVSTETNQYLFLLGESPGPCNMWGKVGWHRVRPRWVVKYNCGVAPTRWQSWRLSCKLDNLLVLVSVLV